LIIGPGWETTIGRGFHFRVMGLSCRFSYVITLLT
jgi:hypothetical protein